MKNLVQRIGGYRVARLGLVLLAVLLSGCGSSGSSSTERPIEEVEAELAPAESGN